MTFTPEQLKRMAAMHSVEFVRSGMVLGLGTGTTVLHAIREIGDRYRNGALRDLVGIPSSKQTEAFTRECGIPLVDFSGHPRIDVTIDGADEVDGNLNIIKGGGAALLREKILAQASTRNVIIVDESKVSNCIGDRWPVPVEVLPFARDVEMRYLESLGATVTVRRKDGAEVTTDQGNIILDAKFGPLSNPGLMASQLDARAGIMAHGLFLDLAHVVVVAGEKGIREMVSKSHIRQKLP